jgi:hypothetical protein
MFYPAVDACEQKVEGFKRIGFVIQVKEMLQVEKFE